MLKVLHDIATLKDGEAYCLAGCLAILGSIALVVFIFMGLWAAGFDIDKMIKIFQAFFEHLMELIGVGAVGKLVTNKAEQ